MTRMATIYTMFAFALMLLAPAPAHAAASEEAQAVKLLVQARTADTRCKFLSATLHNELVSYAVRAEAAANGKIPASQVRAAVSAGTVAGRAMPCNATTKKDVAETLEAARDAIRGSDASEVETTDRSDDDEDEDFAVGSEDESEDSFAFTYQSLVKAYFVERRCRHLSEKQDIRFWKQVVSRQKMLARKIGTGAVARQTRAAEAAADALRCSGKTRRMVNAAFTAAGL
ncbi:MAG: hypothetical protein FJX63_06540 [Alphaproteobacteria bacterium]|nr:hypothetical protein [Alphaproteobacteria bacterium]